MGSSPLAFILLALLASWGGPPGCDGGNVLVFPVDGSHWINMKVLLEELHQRGHQLTVIRAANSVYVAQSSPLYTAVTIDVAGTWQEFFEFMEELITNLRQGRTMHREFANFIYKAHSTWGDAISEFLDDERRVQSLRDSRFDLVLTDPAIAPGVILAKYLDLPLVLNVRWIQAGEGHMAMAPSPLSYVPMPGSGLTDKMNFLQRVKNVFFYVMITLQQKILIDPIYSAICRKHFPGGCDINSLLRQADVWLFRTDFVFDFPRPTMPNVVYIGGFQCRDARPLPAHLEDFVQSAGEHGVIIMSLGSLVNAMPERDAEELAAVFARLPQKVIWRHKGPRPSTLGNNTLVVEWMPQKDLLGHPQTKVFVAHGGTNGLQEAIFYGVPVLGIPLFFDQFDNLVRLEQRGAAKILELGDLSQGFEASLKEVLSHDSYRRNIRKLSELHRDQPMRPMDRAVFWVEYVMRHEGAPHLRTQAYEMPWYAYYGVDVALLLAAIVIAPVLSAVVLARFFCCKKTRKNKAKRQ
ncbi:UDP-glucuronosyltransferase 1-2-like [Syngnathus typhle]|uniref:UDP-glucuronosyltransferase 1-2-like n=1 Tax=Syngnathus typhle TaxID=161592 RepID=UPI002A6B0507|nr:UDP-glucuronosyltransferase 1-2-like [Syngnathus typhle]XP_061155069.1 UDP-glucuronosyltransferase 1-2-like [Syngnathus typhle]XP_061155070.1 UDP-glucuronosyltransferase 1-2-like [Syngnathus typhle]XP_061155071.1 UDP-glucuronosyltransferase 1-2-like [Syngnathus typhle]XP_061155072.1 UDP-glucuronosyltransferase 1-2-like [Syngnathus typhle]XP_061155073.1 UDP-glucuronosyltransferase 1-2-like [Syngnathus typhle]XP_061155074.1 UDP-glucuronosyltransferase 1-2-like [Syngnathus typhle]